ncbi:acetyl-coenzyme A carboxylase carboxyl transferase subunit alpha, chloroplastic-like [Dorcoceras hygrometricum]|uniref:acetyl-CoA carboxytransferase n=1 Tax=Dorcoceras hygrometricum TaxID=472368 RepID=A0A2Z7AXW5_9LAMI|nr:acetyl-coenzyme A carboxylase carboxyl transferase subunit alpha, chloroplastic-like [Dorcoceras hygrometricum]
MNTLSIIISGNGWRARGQDQDSGNGMTLHLANCYFLPRTCSRSLAKDMKDTKLRIGRTFRIFAGLKKWKKHDYPWPDNIDPNSQTPLAYLSNFKPLEEKPKPVTLAFEKPLIDLEKKIIEVQRMADDTGLDFTDQINALELKYEQAVKDLYTHLTPIQRLNIARHPNRPTVLDHILNITEKWVELHGDRAGYDDPAIVTGIGSIEGRSYMFIGHQKGRNTKENIMRNFAMPTPHGYRKALRMMKYADHHGFPIITFVDTPGAYADLKSEELGQGEAIAQNLRTMFGLKVPIITVVTGEGGSGGALAIACSNKLLMLENSAFYVASPEACAAILWKSSQAAPKAAEKLRITAQEHYKLQIADGIIPEPLGGAHADPVWSSQRIKHAILQEMEVEPERKRNMKPSEVNVPTFSDIESELEDLKKTILEAKGPSKSDPATDQKLEKLEKDLDQEMTKAFISMGLVDQIESLNLELASSANTNNSTNQDLNKKADRIILEFKEKLSRPGAYLGLKRKLQTLDMVSRLLEMKENNEKIKIELNHKVSPEVKAKMDTLKIGRDKLAKGDPVDENLEKEIEQAKEGIEEVLRSANLEVVGTTKRETMTPRTELSEGILNVNREIKEEIEKAILAKGLFWKMDEWKVEATKDPKSERVMKLGQEIREVVCAALSESPIKEKLEKLKMTSGMEAMEGANGADNGRL